MRLFDRFRKAQTPEPSIYDLDGQSFAPDAFSQLTPDQVIQRSKVTLVRKKAQGNYEDVVLTKEPLAAVVYNFLNGRLHEIIVNADYSTTFLGVSSGNPEEALAKHGYRVKVRTDPWTYMILPGNENHYVAVSRVGGRRFVELSYAAGAVDQEFIDALRKWCSRVEIVSDTILTGPPGATAPKDAEPAIQQQPGKLPWDWSATAPADDSEFLQSLRGCLPIVFQAIGKRGRDPVVMLVDVEDIRWRGLLGLLHTRHGQPYFSPETAIGQKPQIQQESVGPFYRAPNIDGKELKVGLYVVEREWLVSELCWIRGLPIPFIKQVQKAQSPAGMFTVVYFLKTRLGVRHVSPDASVCEAPELSLSDLM